MIATIEARTLQTLLLDPTTSVKQYCAAAAAYALIPRRTPLCIASMARWLIKRSTASSHPALGRSWALPAPPKPHIAEHLVHRDVQSSFLSCAAA